MISWRPTMRARKLTCHQVGKVLQAYLDGEVPDATSRQVELHLRACRRCGMEAATYERMRSAFAERRPEMDDETVARLRQFVEWLTQDGPAQRV